MDIKIIRHNLIDAIMQTTDFEQLAAMYDLINGKSASKETEAVIERPIKKIPVAKIRKGVTLEEIKAGQKKSDITYEEFSKMVAEEEWDQSIEELLATLD